MHSLVGRFRWIYHVSIRSTRRLNNDLVQLKFLARSVSSYKIAETMRSEYTVRHTACRTHTVRFSSNWLYRWCRIFETWHIFCTTRPMKTEEKWLVSLKRKWTRGIDWMNRWVWTRLTSCERFLTAMSYNWQCILSFLEFWRFSRKCGEFGWNIWCILWKIWCI